MAGMQCKPQTTDMRLRGEDLQRAVRPDIRLMKGHQGLTQIVLTNLI
jgi:hypothetical protein